MRDTQNAELMKAFATELKVRRSALGISQEELAYRSDVGRTFVAKVELAQNQPSLTVLYKLSVGLGVDLHELIRLTLIRYEKERKARR